MGDNVMELMDIVYMIFAFILGAAIGSFLNVLICRLPLNMSIIKPNSHCFSCGSPIKWYDNIPIISYFILHGKCRVCHTPFSFRYCLVEIMTGILYVLVYVVYRLSFYTLIFWVVIACLIVIFFIDLEHYIIPDSMIVTILLMSICSMFVSEEKLNITLSSRLIAFGLVALVFMIIVMMEKLLKKDLMGFGDIKLFGVMALLLGYQLLFTGIFVGAVIALLIEVIIKKGQRRIIPFGPYLAIGFVIMIFLGTQIMNYYHSLFI